jgi:hypothetical protein
MQAGPAAADASRVRRNAGQTTWMQTRQATPGRQRVERMPGWGHHQSRRPNIGFQRTARGAEQERGYFDTWYRLDGFPALSRRRR